MTSIEWLFEQIPLEWTAKRSAFEALQQAKEMYEIEQQNKFTEEQVKQLIKEANYDGQSLHAKSITSQMMRDNAESYSESIIQSLKQPKKD